jgi:hypothetical protein
MTESMAHAPQRFEDHQGIIHMQAKFGLKWATMNGLAMEYEDMYQEACLAFVQAAQGYDPDTGLKFSAYFTKVAFSQFRKTIGIMTGVKNLNSDQRSAIAERKQENKRRAAAGEQQLEECKWGIRPSYFSHIAKFDDGDPFEESIDSGCMSPEQLLEAKQEVERVTANLSPLAQLVVEWLRDPPPELMRELNGQMAFADRCVEVGTRGPQGLRKGLCVENVGKFLQMVGAPVSKSELALVEQELRDMVKALEKA